MLIVLEGCDGTGKTQLAKFLQRIMGAEIIHATKETPNTFAWFNEILDKAKQQNFILDRAFWGQFVYQPKEERKLTIAQVRALEKRLEKEDGKLIYVYSPKSIIEKRLKAREELTALPIRTILFRYKKLCKNASCPVIWYNTHNGLSDIFH